MKYFMHFFTFILFATIVIVSTPAHAGEIQLSWKSPKTPPDFAKFRIHWGEKSGKYTQYKDVAKNKTSVTVSNLKNEKTYYFAATTVAPSSGSIATRRQTTPPSSAQRPYFRHVF